MLERQSPLTLLRAALATRQTTPVDTAQTCIDRANSNAGRNTYLHFDPDTLLRQASSLASIERSAWPALYGVPVSLKDCFDLAGTHTTCGSRFYAARPVAVEDSAVAVALRRAGALIPGKTHLHPLAYGITGQNPEYGDCLQPRDASLLTGGSSSGAAASVQEGSALAAIGTDTGGSIRVPAALCGLCGYRASLNMAQTHWPAMWAGAAHLAPSFDTLGFLLRDARDAAPVAEALFGLRPGRATANPRAAIIHAAFLTDCEDDARIALDAWQQQFARTGVHLAEFDTAGWQDTFEIFAGIQAHEAAQIHSGAFDHFEPAIRDRLRWGASLPAGVVHALKQRLATFRGGIHGLFKQYDLLMMPAAPLNRLPRDADLSDARRIILRYTTPFSMAGLPVISLPGEWLGAPLGTGVQIAAAPGEDAALLAYAAQFSQQIVDRLY